MSVQKTKKIMEKMGSGELEETRKSQKTARPKELGNGAGGFAPVVPPRNSRELQPGRSSGKNLGSSGKHAPANVAQWELSTFMHFYQICPVDKRKNESYQMYGRMHEKGYDVGLFGWYCRYLIAVLGLAWDPEAIPEKLEHLNRDETRAQHRLLELMFEVYRRHKPADS